MNIAAARSRRLLGIFFLGLFGLTGVLTAGGTTSADEPAQLAPASPAPPAASYDCGYGYLKVKGAKDTESVDYTIDITTPPAGEGSNWAVTITATPQPGYQFPPDTTTEWNFTGTVDCENDIVTPAAPAVTYDCAADELMIKGAKDTESVDYTIDITTPPAGEGSNWAVTITATPQPGYEFAPDVTAEWNFTGTVDCLTTTNPAAPSVTYDCATDELMIKGAKDNKSVDYTIDITRAPGGEGSNWAVTITATPQPGYQFPPDTITEWNFTGTVDCLMKVAPAAPSVTNDCATDELMIKGAKDNKSVDYTIDITQAPGGEGSNWAVTITATPQPGYEFAPDVTAEWNFTGIVDCAPTGGQATPTTSSPTTTAVQVAGTLPSTGTSSTALQLACAALVTLVGGLLLLTTRRLSPDSR